MAFRIECTIGGVENKKKYLIFWKKRLFIAIVDNSKNL